MYIHLFEEKATHRTDPLIEIDLTPLSSNGCTMTKNSKRALENMDATPIISFIEVFNSGRFVLNAL